MEFSILGPLEVRAEDHAVTLGGIKPRAAAGRASSSTPNEPVSAERLALALWGEDAPSQHAGRRVQVHVSRLRKGVQRIPTY